MVSTNDQTINVESTIESAQDWLRAVPPELVNIIPESVWMTLSLDNKKEILRQHNILEKYENLSNAEQTTAKVDIAASSVEQEAVVVEQQQRVIRSPEFEKALEDLKMASENGEENKDEVAKPVLTKEELDRIDSEKAQSANVKTYNFFGYQPAQATYSNAKQISNDGQISDSKTWAATLIGKIFSLFQ